MLVALHTDGYYINSVSYAGQVMSLASKRINSSPYNNIAVYVYYLANPAPGTNNIEVKANNYVPIIASAITFNNVDTDNPLSFAQSFLEGSMYMSHAVFTIYPDSMLVDMVTYNKPAFVSITPASGQTQYFSSQIMGQTNNLYSGESYKMVEWVGTSTMGWVTGDNRTSVHAILVLNPKYKQEVKTAGNFILSGGPRLIDSFCVDDDIYVYLNGNLIYSDIDLYKASCDNWPINFQADPGAALRVVAVDSVGICRSIGPLWLHYGDKSVELDSGKDDGCSGWPAGTTFYDKTFTIPQLAEPEPIVLVPGIGACLNLKVMTGLEESSWNWDLVGDYYQGLIKTLETAGFTQGENLFIGCYDWRKTNGLNPDTAVNSGEEYLRHWINEAKEKSGSAKVDIIAHSMGGLISRSYIQGDNYQNDVDQLIMLGTPNHGASDSYYAWEGGEIPKSWKEFKNKIILYLTLLKFKGLNVSNIVAIHDFIPSIKQLLPTYDYPFDTVRQLFVPGSAIVGKNNWLNDLNYETEIAKLNSRVRTQIIYGDSKDTLNKIPVSERGALDIQLGKWIDGKPVAEQIEYEPSGDGTVMSASATLSGVTSIALPGAEHSALPDQAALKIMRALGIQSEQVFSSPDTRSELMFLIASPVFPLVTTPDDAGQIGYDAVSGSLINTIDGARYFSAGDGETKLIIIPNPADGEYSLELTANADGEYHLASGYFSDTISIVKEIAGEVADEQVINYPVNLQSGASGDNILPELVPEKEEESVVVNRLIADIEAMFKKGWIKNKQATQELIQPLKRLNRQLDSINKQTARIKKWIDKINANTKIKLKAKEKISQAPNKRLAKLPVQRAKIIEHSLTSFSKNLENLKKKNKINTEGYNLLIKSIKILIKIL